MPKYEPTTIPVKQNITGKITLLKNTGILPNVNEFIIMYVINPKINPKKPNLKDLNRYLIPPIILKKIKLGTNNPTRDENNATKIPLKTEGVISPVSKCEYI